MPAGAVIVATITSTGSAPVVPATKAIPPLLAASEASIVSSGQSPQLERRSVRSALSVVPSPFRSVGPGLPQPKSSRPRSNPSTRPLPSMSPTHPPLVVAAKLGAAMPHADRPARTAVAQRTTDRPTIGRDAGPCTPAEHMPSATPLMPRSMPCPAPSRAPPWATVNCPLLRRGADPPRERHSVDLAVAPTSPHLSRTHLQQWCPPTAAVTVFAEFVAHSVGWRHSRVVRHRGCRVGGAPAMTGNKRRVEGRSRISTVAGVPRSGSRGTVRRGRVAASPRPLSGRRLWHAPPHRRGPPPQLIASR